MYSATTDIINVLGGTNTRFSVGTGGTNSIRSTIIEYFIGRADNIIDLKTEPIYGTQHFGTSDNGTRGLPQTIRDISADLGAYYTIRGLPVDLRNQLVDLSKKLKEDAYNLLDDLANGKILIPGYSVGDSNIPKTSDYTVTIYDECITLDGTATSALEYQKILKYSERVHGTALDSTTVYTRDVDYKIYYYPEDGDNAGYLRRYGTTIPDGSDVLVDYTVEKEHDIIGKIDQLYGYTDPPDLSNGDD